VLSGKRGKAGAIKVCTTEAAFNSFAKQFLGKDFQGEEVRFIILAEKIEIDHEYYLSINYDTDKKIPFLLFCEEGGADIEEVKVKDPQKILRVDINPVSGPNKKDLEKIFPKEPNFSDFALRLWDVFWKFDCRLCEVNPLAQSGKKELVIIAEDVDGEALATFVVNKLRGIFNVLAVSAPGFGDRRKAQLLDIAILTGGTVISEETGRKFESVEVEDLGRAGRVTSTKDTTLIVDGKGSKAGIDSRISQIRRELTATDSEFDKEKLQERLAKLTGGVAVINVGAATEVEMKEKKERVIDAVAATKAAIEEGIVPGGEIALVKAARLALDNLKLEDEQQLGVKIIQKASEEPLRRLAVNAGQDGGWVVRTITDQFEAKGRKDMNFGYNVLLNEFGDMVAWGIIDPVKVTRSALQNGASVAIMVMTTQVLITDKVEPTPPPPMPHGGMGEY